MSASRQRLLSRRSRTKIRSPPGLGAPPTIGKTCLWIISKDVCLPNAFSRKPLRGPLVTGTNRPGGPNALPLYDVKHPQSLTRAIEPHKNHHEFIISTGHSSKRTQGPQGLDPKGRHAPKTPQNPKEWWSQTGSNRRPEACKATALPTELWPLLAKPRVWSWPQAPAGTSVPLGSPRRSAGARSGWRT